MVEYISLAELTCRQARFLVVLRFDSSAEWRFPGLPRHAGFTLVLCVCSLLAYQHLHSDNQQECRKKPPCKQGRASMYGSHPERRTDHAEYHDACECG